MIRCKPVKVCHHHPQYRVLLDPAYSIYMDDYLLCALPGELELKRFTLHVGWATELHYVAFVVACTVDWSIIKSFHSVAVKLQVLVGIIVDVV